jgi:DNA-binding MarR family transcriptional regulator
VRLHLTYSYVQTHSTLYVGVVAENDGPVAAWRGVLVAQDRVVRAIDRDLADAGRVPLSWYDVLLELNAAPGRCLRMHDLSRRVVLSRSRVSRLVDDLERQRLVERRADPGDGRATLACLTPQGRGALRRAAPIYLRGIDRYFTTHLDEAERATIARAMQRVIDAHDPAGDR